MDNSSFGRCRMEIDQHGNKIVSYWVQFDPFSTDLGVILRVELGQFSRDEIARLSGTDRTIGRIIGSYLGNFNHFCHFRINFCKT